MNKNILKVMIKTTTNVKLEIDRKTKTIRFFKITETEITKAEYLQNLTVSDSLKKDITLLISKCKNSP